MSMKMLTPEFNNSNIFVLCPGQQLNAPAIYNHVHPPTPTPPPHNFGEGWGTARLKCGAITFFY